MKTIKGDIWEEALKTGGYIIIPTNIGWKKNGENVMGRGVAYQSKKYFPELAMLYGKQCSILGEEACCILFGLQYDNISPLCIATKELDKDKPYLSWQNNSSLLQIEKSLKKFTEIFISNEELFYFPLLGCGNGGLNKEDVLPLMEEYLGKYDNCILVLKNG